MGFIAVHKKSGGAVVCGVVLLFWHFSRNARTLPETTSLRRSYRCPMLLAIFGKRKSSLTTRFFQSVGSAICGMQLTAGPYSSASGSITSLWDNLTLPDYSYASLDSFRVALNNVNWKDLASVKKTFPSDYIANF